MSDKKVYAMAGADCETAGGLPQGYPFLVLREYDSGFIFIDETGTELYGLWKGCYHLHGADWTRLELEESEADEKRTIAQGLQSDPLDSRPNSEPDADRYSVGADTFPQAARDKLLKRAQERNLNPYDAPGFLEAALGHMEDRKTTYDAPEGERSMGKTVAAFNAIRGRDLSEEEGWLFMVLLKAVRTQQGAFRADNYEDGAAYFALQGEAAARDRKHGQ